MQRHLGGSATAQTAVVRSGKTRKNPADRKASTLYTREPYRRPVGEKAKLRSSRSPMAAAHPATPASGRKPARRPAASITATTNVPRAMTADHGHRAEPVYEPLLEVLGESDAGRQVVDVRGGARFDGAA